MAVMIPPIALLQPLLCVGLKVKHEKFSLDLGNTSLTKQSQLKVDLLAFFPKLYYTVTVQGMSQQDRGSKQEEYRAL